jgi:DNA polymerase IV
MRGKQDEVSKSDKPKFQDKFACMKKNDDKSNALNPNSRTIEKLGKMGDYYARTGDHWRATAYRKCITALRKHPQYIGSRDEAIKIPGIGERLGMKIEEIAVTDRLQRWENTYLDPADKLLQLFMGIYQVGLPTASRWVAQGYQSLEDLSSKADLTANQKVGIEHYEDFLTRIPRDEVKAHGDIVREACSKADANIQTVIGGSYRRGTSDSGDVDVIITKEGASLEHIATAMTDTVIPQLFKQGFLKVTLAASRPKQGGSLGSKWHGASALPDSKIWRRIDLLFVPWDEYGAALLYFTGNDIFNRSIRLLASKKHMRLNQHGLYGDVMRGRQRRKITKGRLLESRSEKRIFEILGVPWRPPEQRIC